MEINKIYQESCIETLSRIEDGFVDLVVTSPPYNMRMRVKDGKYQKNTNKLNFTQKYSSFDDCMPIDDFYNFHKKVIQELLRVSKIVCYNFQIVTGSKEAFFKIIGDFSTYIKDVIIWDKGSGEPAINPNVLNSCYELILIMESNNVPGRVIKNAFFERGTQSNIIRKNNKSKISKELSNVNSATFSESLVGTLVRCFSKENQIIYDPFSGTGTTAIVASKLNRKYLGSEITQEGYDTSINRINSNKGLFN